MAPKAVRYTARLEGTPEELEAPMMQESQLEETLEEPSLVALVERFEGHRFSSRDVLLLLAAGLRAGGTEVSAETLAQAEIEGGPVAASQAAAELLARAFVVPV